ncbi:MAG: hypothetical protein P1V20_24225, partial [Verrucomicrobiales bacterium]|nr:hypothetical protein [Verrucomicrobiales bacterium]
MQTIRQYITSDEAFLAKIKLGAHGIESSLANEFIVQMDWFYSNAVGGICLQVTAEDVAEANRILNGEYGEKAGNESSSVQWVCNSCRSSEVRIDPRPKSIFLLSYLLLTFPICFGRQLVCSDCKATWRANFGKRVAWQFFGLQIMLPGVVLLLIYIVTQLGPVLTKFVDSLPHDVMLRKGMEALELYYVDSGFPI